MQLLPASAGVVAVAACCCEVHQIKLAHKQDEAATQTTHSMELQAQHMCFNNGKLRGQLLPCLQVADRLETAVNSALDQGYRTKDLWKEGTQLTKCSEMGNLLVDMVSA